MGSEKTMAGSIHDAMRVLRQEDSPALFFGMTSTEVMNRVAQLGRESQASLAGDRASEPAPAPGFVTPDGRPNLGCFTDRARRCLKFARRTCLTLGHARMGTGHLLAGIAIEGAGIGGHVLGALGLSGEVVMGYLGLAPGCLATLAAPGCLEVVYETPALTRALLGAGAEAHLLSHNHVGTEHLLISLMRDTTSYAARLCELSCESAHLVIENTLLLCAPTTDRVVYADTSWSPLLQIIETCLTALGDAGRRDPLTRAAMADMSRGVVRFRHAASEWLAAETPPLGPVAAPGEAPAGASVANFGALWEALHQHRATNAPTAWNGKGIDATNRDLWRQVLHAQAASLARHAEAEGWGRDALTRAHEDLEAPTSPHDMG